jgi:DNA-binding response OmpR family regulator
MEQLTNQSRKPVSILLAEDDREMRRMLSGILAREGYFVQPCADGMELLERLDTSSEKVAERRYDLIVSDIRMPGFSGLEILDYVRDSDHQTPVLLITAFGDERTHARAEVLGAAGILDKPFDIDEFSKTVISILWERRQSARSAGHSPWHTASPSTPPVEVVFHGLPRQTDIVEQVHSRLIEMQTISPHILHCRVVLSGAMHGDRVEHSLARAIVTLPGKVFVVDGTADDGGYESVLRTSVEELFQILEGRIRKYYSHPPSQSGPLESGR